MAFGSDPVMERFRRDFFEERDGQMFLTAPHFKAEPMPISYELYLELSNAHEAHWRIGKAVLFVCTISGLLFGAYRWLASDDLVKIFVFAGLGLLVGFAGGFVLNLRVPDRMGRIYGCWLKAQKSPRSARASTDDLF